jgi:hypothetical protein
VCFALGSYPAVSKADRNIGLTSPGPLRLERESQLLTPRKIAGISIAPEISAGPVGWCWR